VNGCKKNFIFKIPRWQTANVMKIDKLQSRGDAELVSQAYQLSAIFDF